MISRKFSTEILGPVTKLLKANLSTVDRLLEGILADYETNIEKRGEIAFGRNHIESLAKNPQQFEEFVRKLSDSSGIFGNFEHELERFIHLNLKKAVYTYPKVEKLKRKVKEVEDEGKEVPAFIKEYIRQFTTLEPSSEYKYLRDILPNYVKLLADKDEPRSDKKTYLFFLVLFCKYCSDAIEVDLKEFIRLLNDEKSLYFEAHYNKINISLAHRATFLQFLDDYNFDRPFNRFELTMILLRNCIIQHCEQTPWPHYYVDYIGREFEDDEDIDFGSAMKLLNNL